MKKQDNIPKIFISYSHDSKEHKEWVLNLSNKLRNDAFDSIIDQADLKVGGNLGSFMNLIEEVDRVLVICTKKYYEKSQSKKGGFTDSQNAARINLTVNGAIDAEGTARTIISALNDSYYRGTGGASALQAI